jgi:hypothetical protein
MTTTDTTETPPPGSPTTFEAWESLPTDIKMGWAKMYPAAFNRLCEIAQSKC